MGIGTDIPRVDGLDKLSGRALYVDDLVKPGMWHGATVRTTIARGRLKKINFGPGIPWDEFVIVDHTDIKKFGGVNEVQFIECEQPALVADEFHHMHEPVVLLAHPDPDMLRRGRQAVTLECEALPTIFDPRDAVTPELLQYKKDNVFKHIHIRKGAGEDDAAFDKIFATAAHVFEADYFTGAQEHVYLENQGMIAWVEPNPPGAGKITVQGTMQCPYYVLKSLTHLYEKPNDAFRVIQTPTGGGFGGKEDYPSIIAIHATLLALKAGRPVKIIYDRHEDMTATTKRHPMWAKHRTAVDADGKLLAQDIDVVMDGGAYMTLSPVVLSRGVIHAAGPYYCPNVRILGEVRLTNSPPHGAFRGFGAPQTLFAQERQMDLIATKLGLDPAEFRKKNLLKTGQMTATSQVMKDPVDIGALQDKTLALAHYAERRAEYARENPKHPWKKRGVGFATFFHGAGFTGSGETMLASQAWVEAMPDGSVEVLTANTDIGQGTETVLAMVASSALALPQGRVRVIRPDTSRVPNSGPTVASRTTMVVGKLVENACRDLQQVLTNGTHPATAPPKDAPLNAELGQLASDDPALALHAGPEEKFSGTITPPPATNGHLYGEALMKRIVAWHAAHPGERLLGRAQYQTPASVQWDDVNYRGSAYATYAYAIYVADVEVDLRTYNVAVKDFVALQEIGKVVHPVLAEGQIQGGVVQGIGWALMEEVVFEQGAMKNAQLTNYIIPTSGDLPPIRVYFEEVPTEFGPGGAKGIGELPMDGPAPAILNAICHALERQDLNEIPLTAERLMQSLGRAKT